MPRSGTVGFYGSSTSNFLRYYILFSTVGAPAYIPTNSVGGLPFLHTHKEGLFFPLCWRGARGTPMGNCISSQPAPEPSISPERLQDVLFPVEVSRRQWEVCWAWSDPALGCPPHYEGSSPQMCTPRGLWQLAGQVCGPPPSLHFGDVSLVPGLHTPQPPSLPLSLKTLPWKPWGVQAFWAPPAEDSLLGTCNKHFTLLLTSHPNLVSVKWLYRTQANGPEFDSVTHQALNTNTGLNTREPWS